MKTERILPAAMLIFLSLFFFAENTTPASPPSCVPDGLTAWWRGENNALDTVGLYSGTPVGGMTFVSGKVGQAFSFDGLDDHIVVGDSPSLSPHVGPDG